MRVLSILILFVFTGCSGGNGRVDAGTGDADGGDDHGDDGGGGDVDLGDDLGLRVPSGTCACGAVFVNSTAPAGTLERKGRVCFRPGLHRLYKDQETFQADLIESVELGPEAVAGAPAGAGVVTVTPPAQPDGEYSFEFQQEFTAGATPLTVSLRVVFPCQNSEPSVDVVTLDDAGMCDQLFSISASWEDTPTWLGSCQYSLYYCGILKLEIQGGDELKLEICHYCPGDWICKSSNAGMLRAEYRSGSDSRYQGDYFGLAHSMRHHDWGSDSLVRFDQALGSVQAIYVGTNQYPDHFSYSQATYLDGDLNVLENRSVTGFEYLDQW